MFRFLIFVCLFVEKLTFDYSFWSRPINCYFYSRPIRHKEVEANEIVIDIKKCIWNKIILISKMTLKNNIYIYKIYMNLLLPLLPMNLKSSKQANPSRKTAVLFFIWPQPVFSLKALMMTSVPSGTRPSTTHTLYVPMNLLARVNLGRPFTNISGSSVHLNSFSSKESLRCLGFVGLVILLAWDANYFLFI